jgi:hypothetical protein
MKHQIAVSTRGMFCNSGDSSGTVQRRVTGRGHWPVVGGGLPVPRPDGLGSGLHAALACSGAGWRGALPRRLASAAYERRRVGSRRRLHYALPPPKPKPQEEALLSLVSPLAMSP